MYVFPRGHYLLYTAIVLSDVQSFWLLRCQRYSWLGLIEVLEVASDVSQLSRHRCARW